MTDIPVQNDELPEEPQSAEPGLAEQLKLQEEEIAKYKDMYLRAMAETENVRTRAKRDLDDNNKYAATRFARDIVNIVENVQRASDSITADARAKNDVLKQVGEGIDMTLQEILGIFERHGIRRVNPEGEKFDHNLHQAVGELASEGIAPGSVSKVLQAGYMIHDRLLKPAMVMVSPQAKSSADNAA